MHTLRWPLDFDTHRTLVRFRSKSLAALIMHGLVNLSLEIDEY